MRFSRFLFLLPLYSIQNGPRSRSWPLQKCREISPLCVWLKNVILAALQYIYERWAHSVWKSPKMSHFWFFAKMDHFGHSSWTFVRSKCKGSSLRWQCWMRLWGRFSHNMVMMRSSPSFRMLSQFCRIPFTTSRPPKKRSGRAASSRFFGPMLALGNIARYYFPCFKAAAAAAATGQYFIERRNLRPLSSLLENWALGLLWAPWTVVPFSLLRGVQASFELENEAVKTPCLKITEKVASVYILSGQKLIKNGLFWRVFENSVTRQVNFNRTKVDGKCQIFYPALSGSSLRSILGKLFKVEIDFAIVAIEEFCRQKVRDLCEGSHYSCARMRRGAECILKVRASGQARVEMARANKRWGQQMVSRLF